MGKFVHLHVHSEYSLLDGLAKLPKIIKKAQELDMDTIALTDHGAMYGAYNFYREATKAGIKPIIGCEVYQAEGSIYNDPPQDKKKDRYHLLLLSKNETGYKNLMKLTSIAHLDGFHYKPRIDLDVLAKHSDGLICLSGCLQGLLNQYILRNEDSKAEELVQKFMKIFPEDHYYLELQRHPGITELNKVNDKLLDLSRTYGIPVVATNDVHYLKKEHAEAQEILLCIQTQRTMLEKNRPLSMIDTPDFYMKTASEMQEQFQDIPEAIENTVKIAEMVDIKIKEGELILPPFDVPDGSKPKDYLRKISLEKLPSRYANASEVVKKRLEYELEVIINKGYATYFLIVADFVNWAKDNGIAVGPGRGSAAGSLVAYVLGITALDPIDLELPFERFLNPDRPSPPDIDLDFADNRRDEVIEYVVKKYGENHVAQIITFGSMEARQAIRDVGRALGMPYSAPDRIAKLIPPNFQGFKKTIDDALEESKELRMAYSSEEETKKLLDLAKQLEGVSRHASVHAAAVVIADKDLTEYTPLLRESKGNKIITQYDMYALDINADSDGRAIGLLKMDFLGLRTLTILQSTIEYIQQTQGKTLDVYKLPADDKKTYEMISSGETTGVFQLESRGMRQLAKKLEPNKFSDISAMVALYRPGPMQWINDFVAGKQNPNKIRYPHPDLKSVLAETYGIAVYQEQCMQIANQLAGYSMVEADALRYAIGKKKKKAMQKERIKFIAGCQKNGYSKEVAEKIWSLIEKFAAYGFNKPHSASYGLIAYQTAYMKTHYPVEFMTAVLSAESRATSGPIRDEKMAQAVKECKRMKIKLLAPDVNKSMSDFAIENNDSIRFGLSAVKNVGRAAIDVLLAARIKGEDFKSLSDFTRKADLSKVNRKTIESLIKAGAMDIYGNRMALLSALPEIMAKANNYKKQQATGQSMLFGDTTAVEENDKLIELEELQKSQQLMLEKEMLGFYLTDHPLGLHREALSKMVTHNIVEVGEELVNENIKIGGIVSSLKKVYTRKDNKEMAFGRIEDESGSVDFVVFPKPFERYKSVLESDGILVIAGKVNMRDEGINVMVDKIKTL